ncbi:putative disease resistance protein [Vitis vinifera]|uniref:Putative disease resistance protein n=1 Tax=Vitis vinifera TaxID=29760 RepID=A0A438GKU9_VITVI|nr:putative disease resistance protein [Vitis vinifera]
MTKVNNEFIKASKSFEIAIWVVVSRPTSVEKIQEVIRNKLDILDNRWRNRTEDEKAVEIFNVLKAKRFVMLLDDVWERLDLQKSGDEAIYLFKKKVGETTLNSHPIIPQLAEIDAKECKGLPLALITIGRAMAGKNAYLLLLYGGKAIIVLQAAVRNYGMDDLSSSLSFRSAGGGVQVVTGCLK